LRRALVIELGEKLIPSLAARGYLRWLVSALSRLVTTTRPMRTSRVVIMGGGSRDGEEEDFAVLKPEHVIERDRAAGKLTGHRDR
jgi:hypothetical protein